jgi:hypothetical protein
MRRSVLAVGAFFLGIAADAAAQPFPESDLPPALRPWAAWVRDETPDRVCTAVGGTAVCLWPGRLDLRLGAGGGGFGLDAYADRAVDLPLPGDVQRWPQDVRLDARPAVVTDRDGVPFVRIASGAHRIEGRFVWSHLPDSLPVPQRLALVDLAVEGRSVPQPRRDEAGLVWLRAEGQSVSSAESLRIQVFRRIADGIPMWAETRLSLEVSGKAREVELRGALLPESVPVAVLGDLPARLDASGRLRVQVRAGSFNVTVLARLSGQPAALLPPKVEEPWPAREVWVFAADETLRQVELTGLSPIDPSRTDLPPEWRKLPAFVVDAGQRLALKQVRRGEPEPPPDRIQLHRELWLDVSGQAFTIRDRFSGSLARTWRLDVQRPGELGRAAFDRAEQLITANPTSQALGVELRRGQLSLEADSRLARAGRLPAVGWSADVEQLGDTVHLPPGWWLLTASGVDSAPGAWTARWTLLGFFFVIIVALAVGRLFGRVWGVLALLAMVFSYAEPGAPFLVWLSLLGAVALTAVAPEGRLRSLARLWRGLTLVALVLILAPFLRDQVRQALYPQVDAPEAVSDSFSLPMVRNAVPPAAAPPPPPAQFTAPQEEAKSEAADQVEESVTVEGDAETGVAGVEAGPAGVAGGIVGGVPASPKTAEKRVVRPEAQVARAKANRYFSSLNAALEQDPRAVLQTGPGMPTWTWRSYALAWSGPVKSDQTLRLFLVSPGWNRFLTVLRLLFVLLLATRLSIGGTAALTPTGGGGAAAALALALLLLAPASARAAESDVPDRALLDELKRRLTRLEPCQPRCVSTSALRLRLTDASLVFEAEVHAADSGAWAIPGPPASWAPALVRVDGQATSALARLDDGFLYVRLRPGLHRIEAIGPSPRADTLTLQLRDRPMRATADTPGWDVAGFRADGPPDTSMQLSRRLRAGERAREETGRYAPWLEITRTLTLGLTWRVRTEVRRVSPIGAPVSLRVPLLAGESPTEADLETEEGVALVALGRDQTEAGWSSTLPVTEALRMKAAEGQPWSEVWRLECGVIWQCEADGLAPIAHQHDGVLSPEYRPWPGESLALRFRHPQAAPGQTVTLDSVKVETTPGQRYSDSVLSLTARTSRDEPLVLTLPAAGEVQEVTLDGGARPGKPEQGRLRLTVPAGRHAVVVKWREPRGIGLYHRVPVVGLGVPAVNVEAVLHLPESRWLLLTRGPLWGPAVLFWGYLVFAVLVALVLGLVAESPLGAGEWLLLALGLTQSSAPGALVIVGLFLALSWRERRPRASALAHDALQVLLGLWAVVALVLLYDVVRTGLLLWPDMQVAGAGSSNGLLRWYSDRVAADTPAAAALSLPLWVYRGLMLAWALWLASRLIRWTGWAWRSLGTNGLWRAVRPGAKARAPLADAPLTDAPEPKAPPTTTS